MVNYFMKLALIFLILPFINLQALEHILISENQSRVIKVSGLKRVSVANEKIAKIRAVPPNEFLIIGKKSGKTTVQVWLENGKEDTYEITVIKKNLSNTLTDSEEVQVIRINLEFVEIDVTNRKDTGILLPNVIELSTEAGYNQTQNLSYSINASIAKTTIAQMISDGSGRVVANPTIFVRLGEEASFHAGGEFPVISGGERYGTYYKKVEWKPYGLTVKIRPESADMVTLSSDIEVEISERDSSINIEGVPGFIKRKMTTKMLSGHDESVILSGLRKRNASNESTKTPILSFIPIIGPIFFSKNSVFDGETELIMIMTLGFKGRLLEQAEIENVRNKISDVKPTN